MISTHRCVLVGLSLALACSGCAIPVLKNPLVKPADAKAVAALYGVYRKEDRTTNFVSYVHAGPAGGDFPAGFVRIICVDQPKDAESALKDPITYIGFLERVGKYYVLQLPLPKKAPGTNEERRSSWDQKWDESQVEGYLVVRLLVSDDGVEMARLDDEFVKEQVKAKKLTGEVAEKRRERDGVVEIEDGPVTITAKTAELREYFARQIDGGLFNKPNWKFERVK